MTNLGYYNLLAFLLVTLEFLVVVAVWYISIVNRKSIKKFIRTVENNARKVNELNDKCVVIFSEIEKIQKDLDQNEKDKAEIVSSSKYKTVYIDAFNKRLNILQLKFEQIKRAAKSLKETEDDGILNYKPVQQATAWISTADANLVNLLRRSKRRDDKQTKL